MNRIKSIFSTAYFSAEEDSAKHLQKQQLKPDYKVMLICIIVAFSLTMIKYLGDVRFMLSFLRSTRFTSITATYEDLMTINKNADLYRLLYWVGVMIVFYFIVPAAVIIFGFKQTLSDYGLRIKGAFKDYKLYVLMLCVMIPLVLFFSRTESFQERYPFYDVQKGEPFYPNFIVWEIFYFLQFFALEFFFRGFMLHGTKQRFGFYSVFVMTIPYCMIHYGKPLPETIAAIIAGIVLGTLSLKSKSIWLGVAIHYSVAITMDLCAMYHKDLL
jgi:membrane protease YdiL (CAAX protease family)